MSEKKCDFCGYVGTDVRLISDGTDSGESDLYCAQCYSAEPISDSEFDELVREHMAALFEAERGEEGE